MGLPQQEQKKILVVDDEPDLTMNSDATTRVPFLYFQHSTNDIGSDRNLKFTNH
jgi:hypothetical protein